MSGRPILDRSPGRVAHATHTAASFAPSGSRAAPASGQIPHRENGEGSADVPRWIVPFILVSALLSDRVFLLVSTGGHGVLPVLSIVAPLAAIAALSRRPPRTRLAFLEDPAFVLAVLPYIVLTAVLPILGVMLNGYPARTLFTITEATSAVSFIVLGSIIGRRADRALGRWLPVAIMVTTLYAIGQTVYWSSGPGWQLFQPFAQWDVSLAALAGQLDSIGRSTGLFTNPNELGLWGAVASVLAWRIAPPRWRGVAVAGAVVTLVLSQSRGAAVGLLAAVMAGTVLALARRELSPRAVLRATAAMAVVGGLTVAAVLIAPSEVRDRFGGLLNVLTSGPQGDSSLSSRLALWGGVIAQNLSSPFGTLGQPELVLGTAVDSQWFEAFAQGSVPLLAALTLLLSVPFAMLNSRSGTTLALVVVVLAVTGLTQLPFDSSVIVVFWALLGAVLQSRALERRAAAPWSTPASARRRTPQPTRARSGRSL